MIWMNLQGTVLSKKNPKTLHSVTSLQMKNWLVGGRAGGEGGVWRGTWGSWVWALQGRVSIFVATTPATILTVMVTRGTHTWQTIVRNTHAHRDVRAHWENLSSVDCIRISVPDVRLWGEGIGFKHQCLGNRDNGYRASLCVMPRHSCGSTSISRKVQSKQNVTRWNHSIHSK